MLGSHQSLIASGGTGDAAASRRTRPSHRFPMTRQQVDELIRLYYCTDESKSVLARRFGISMHTLNRAVNRRDQTHAYTLEGTGS